MLEKERERSLLDERVLNFHHLKPPSKSTINPQPSGLQSKRFLWPHDVTMNSFQGLLQHWKVTTRGHQQHSVLGLLCLHVKEKQGFNARALGFQKLMLEVLTGFELSILPRIRRLPRIRGLPMSQSGMEGNSWLRKWPVGGSLLNGATPLAQPH